MFFFSPLMPNLVFHVTAIYVLAAVLPAVFLMRYVYRLDRIEREPVPLLISLIGKGIWAALAAIVQEAGSRFGARDLRRVVRKRVEDPVAEKLIAGEPISHLLLDAEGGKLLLQNKDQ